MSFGWEVESARLEHHGEFVDVIGKEGDMSVEKLIQHNAKGPNIALGGVDFVEEHLRRHVHWGPDGGTVH